MTDPVIVPTVRIGDMLLDENGQVGDVDAIREGRPTVVVATFETGERTVDPVRLDFVAGPYTSGQSVWRITPLYLT